MKSTETENDLLGLAETCAALGKHHTQVTALQNRGFLSGVRNGGKWYFTSTEIELCRQRLAAAENRVRSVTVDYEPWQRLIQLEVARESELRHIQADANEARSAGDTKRATELEEMIAKADTLAATWEPESGQWAVAFELPASSVDIAITDVAVAEVTGGTSLKGASA